MKGGHIKGLYLVSKNDIDVDTIPVPIGYMIGNILSDAEKQLLYPDDYAGCYLLTMASKGVLLYVLFFFYHTPVELN